MDKEEILKRSRAEHEGRRDEREMMAHANASRTGMAVGAILCVALVWASEFLLHSPEVGLVGWLVYFAMQGSGNVVLYRQLRNRKDLIWAVVELVFAAAFAVCLAVYSLR
ncbi:MAG: hypothetical protein IJ960_02865 [Oscillospiraceae bacterium]|nr:hypothetical protein [Oscillospiraceae bacterium]